MPGSRGIVQVGYPASRQHLKREVGGLKDALDYLAFRDVVWKLHDFDEDTINLDYWAVAKGGGTADGNFVTALAANGTIANTTGTDDNNYTSIVGPAIYAGDNYAWMEARLKFDAVTTLRYEVGLIDAAQTAGATLDIDTPTSNATDYAVVAMDTDQTLVTSAFVTDGTAIAPKKTNLSDLTLPAAGVYMTVRVQCMGPSNVVKCWVDGKEVIPASGEHTLEGGTLLAPWVFVQARAASAARICTIDYIAVGADRV